MLRFLLFCLVPFIVTSQSQQHDWSSLTTLMTQNSTLHGPIFDSEYDKCMSLASDPFQVSAGANGICMHLLNCSHTFCDKTHYGYNLPSYVLETRGENDLSEAMRFANDNNIKVSVKTTGHSLQGSSTRQDSLLIWMHNFPKDGQIKKNYTDSCGNVHDVIGIGGGETWDDVLAAVKGDYHIVASSERTTSAAGGWLQGGGLSYTSRLYGLGVDNVIDFRVVLADGSIVIADNCTNPSLFWALRGGGGGTFGVVTHIHYKLHKVTPIVRFSFLIYGRESLEPDETKPFLSAVQLWLDYWISNSLTLEDQWCGGHFSQVSMHLLFCGELSDAKLSFINDFYAWHNSVLGSLMKQKQWGTFVFTKVHDSWFDYMGGTIGLRNPDYINPTNTFFDASADVSCRILPYEKLARDPFNVIRMFLSQPLVDSSFGFSNYFLGGKINSVKASETAVHPSMRESIYSVFSKGDMASEYIREFLPNTMTGVCYNYHNVLEPDWRNACWDSQYDSLDQVKKEYDPNNRLDCWHCVGYTGEEFTFSPSPSISIPPSDYPSPSPTYTQSPSNATDSPSDYPSSSPTRYTQDPSYATDSPSDHPSSTPTYTQVPTDATDSPSDYPSSTPTYTQAPTETQNYENPYALFLLKETLLEDGILLPSVRPCKWLAKRPFTVRRRYCSSKKYQLFSPEDGLAPASRTCRNTCSPFCVKEVANSNFLFGSRRNEDGDEVVSMRQCKWIKKQKPNRIATICSNTVIFPGNVYGVYGQAFEVCTETCASCTSIRNSTILGNITPKMIFKPKTMFDDSAPNTTMFKPEIVFNESHS